MNNIYFIVAPSGTGKTLICKKLRELYGISYKEYDCATSAQVETHDLYVIDPKGVDYFREHYKGSKTVKVIYIDSPVSVVYERMRQRAENNGMNYSDAVEESLKRWKNDIAEFYDYIHHTAKVDFTVMNNTNTTIDELVEKVYQFIKSTEESEVS